MRRNGRFQGKVRNVCGAQERSDSNLITTNTRVTVKVDGDGRNCVINATWAIGIKAEASGGSIGKQNI